MYIKRVVLHHIKGFDECDLDFCPDSTNYAGWSVVTGDNGSGKTALLRAIALAVLGPDQSRALAPDLTGWVTTGKKTGTISVEIRPVHDYDRTLKGGYPAQTFWAELAIVPVSEPSRSSSWVPKSTDIFRRKKIGAANGPWAPSTSGWLCVAYGPFRRLYGSSPDAQRLMVIPGRIPRFATLFKEDATLAEGEEWLKTLNYRKLEKHQREERVLRDLLALLRKDFLGRGWQLDRVDSTGVWIRDARARVMPLSDVSEGYRAAIAMLVDIFRHMVEVYGPEIVSETNGSVVVDRPGVIMIDEADAHLHPEWQRTLGPWLTGHFPKVQFIVTTHSPLIAQAADNGRIYHLPSAAELMPFQLSTSDYDTVRAGRADQVLLTPAFGLLDTRSQWAVRARQRHAALVARRIAGEMTADEQQELNQLSFLEDVDEGGIAEDRKVANQSR